MPEPVQSRQIAATIRGGPHDGIIVQVPLGVRSVLFPLAPDEHGFRTVECPVVWERDRAVILAEEARPPVW